MRFPERIFKLNRCKNLVLERDIGESVDLTLGDTPIEITVVSGGDRKLRLAFRSPANVLIYREQIEDKAKAGGVEGQSSRPLVRRRHSDRQRRWPRAWPARMVRSAVLWRMLRYSAHQDPWRARCDLHLHIINLANVIRDEDGWQGLVDKLDTTLFHPVEMQAAQQRCVEREQDAAGGGLFGGKSLPLNLVERIDWAADYAIACWMGRGGHAGKGTEFSQGLAVRWTASGGDSAVRFRCPVARAGHRIQTQV